MIFMWQINLKATVVLLMTDNVPANKTTLVGPVLFARPETKDMRTAAQLIT